MLQLYCQLYSCSRSLFVSLQWSQIPLLGLAEVTNAKRSFCWDTLWKKRVSQMVIATVPQWFRKSVQAIRTGGGPNSAGEHIWQRAQMPNISMRQHLSLGCWAWLKHLDWKRSAFMSCKSNEVWDQVAIKSNSCKWGIRGVLGTRLTEFIFQAAQSDSDRQTDGRKNGHMDALHIASDTRHHTNNIKICVCVHKYIYIYIQYIHNPI